VGIGHWPLAGIHGAWGIGASGIGHGALSRASGICRARRALGIGNNVRQGHWQPAPEDGAAIVKVVNRNFYIIAVTAQQLVSVSFEKS